jgi:NADPH2:quinone reductase
MKAIRVHQHGGPEVLSYEDAADPVPAAGEVLIRVSAAGVNFIDVYHRTGQYPGKVPYTPGGEAAGRVEAVGDDVRAVAVGDLVATAQGSGCYAELALASASRVVGVPAGVEAETAAALMLQGMTAHYLATATYPLKRGDTCVVHAAAGGVGLLLCQIAHMRGARVIGTTSTEEKAALALAAGADHVVLYTRENLADSVREITGGKGAQVVYDSVGKTTFDQSLDSLAPRGTLVLFGQSSGAVPAFDPQLLNKKGSLYLTRPSLAYYTASREELVARARDLFAWVKDGSLNVHIGQRYPLENARDAHVALESRQTVGKILLVPG